MRHSIPLLTPDSQPLGGSTPGMSPSIRPMQSSLGGQPRPATPAPAAAGSNPAREVAPEPPPPKIQAFEQKMGRKHEDKWTRSPNVTGAGAIHVKSFHCKLSDDSLAYMDQQINEWLDAHPQYEVKFVTTAVGEWTGKIREPQMVVQVWV